MKGSPTAADHAGRVRRLRVPALQALPAGAAPDPRRVPQRREALLQALPAAAAHERAPGGRGGRRRRRSRGSSGRTRTSSGTTRTTCRRPSIEKSPRRPASTSRSSARTWTRRRREGAGAEGRDRGLGRRHLVHARPSTSTGASTRDAQRHREPARMDQGRAQVGASRALALLGASPGCATAGAGGGAARRRRATRSARPVPRDHGRALVAARTRASRLPRARSCCSTSGRRGAAPASRSCRCSTTSPSACSADGVEILAVSVDQERANVVKFLRRAAPLVADDRARSARARSPIASQPDKMPTSYIIDRAGDHPLREQRLRAGGRRRPSSGGLLDVAGH